MSTNQPGESVVRNQSHVRYSFGENSYITYSNMIDTPLVGPKISILKGTAAVEAQPGAPVAFHAVITNTGNLAADVTLYDLLPSGTQFVANSVVRDQVPIPGADLTAGFMLGSLAPGAQTSIAYQLAVRPTGGAETLTNRLLARFGFVAGNGRLVEGEVLSNEVTISVATVSAPVLAAVLSVDKSRAAPGETLRYSLLAVNQGVLSADVTVYISAPDGTLFVPNSLRVNGNLRTSSSPLSGVYLGAIPQGGEAEVSYEAAVPGYGAAKPGLLVSNQAFITAAYTLPGQSAAQNIQASSNVASTTMVFPVIQADISVMPGIVGPEEPVEFVVCILNSGNLEAAADLGRLIPGQLILVPGSFRVNGAPAPNPGSSGLLPLAVISPQQHLVVTYRAIVSPFIVSPIVTASVVVYYTFTLNGALFRGEIASNLYRLIVETSEE